MKLSSLQIGAVSTLVAIVLWFIATIFEDDTRWLPKESSLEAPAATVIRDESPVRVGTDVLSCQQTETQLVQKVEEAKYCSMDEDCTLFDYGYPIQCMTSVSKNSISALRLEYRNYEQSCAYRVYYDCPSGEMERVPVCRNNRCAVELKSNDPLQDETLQHLGIKPL